MLLMTSTNDIIRVVTGSAADVDVHASYVDNASGTITPGRTNTPAITTATTTTVVGSPPASTQRNVKAVFIHNTSLTVTTTVTVQHFDGTTNEDLINCTLLPDEHLNLNEDGTWVHRDPQLGLYTYSAPARPCLGPTGCMTETIPRELCPEVNTAALTSGTLYLNAIYLTAGQVVNSVSFWAATTASGTPTNGFFGLYDANRNQLAITANFTTEAWAANSVKTKALTAAYKVPVSGLYYLAIMITATTVPTLKGGTAKTGGQLAAAAPILHGNSTTGLTTLMPALAAAITGGTTNIYGGVF